MVINRPKLDRMSVFSEEFIRVRRGLASLELNLTDPDRLFPVPLYGSLRDCLLIHSLHPGGKRALFVLLRLSRGSVVTRWLMWARQSGLHCVWEGPELLPRDEKHFSGTCV